MSASLKYFIPLALGLAVLAAWQELVRFYAVPVYLLPAPSDVWAAFVANLPELMSALWVTLRIVAAAFVIAALSGVFWSVVFAQSRIVEMALYPYAVALQVTPVVAIAPLIIILVGFDRIDLALLIIAWIVAFFPILANTTIGLRSADANLMDLFRLYGASRWQILWRLQLPSALPYLLGALKVTGGLSLIGVIVAEFVAGTGTDTGLGWTITQAMRNLEIAKMFAALALLALFGIAIFAALSALEYALLHKWYESALKTQR